MNVSCVVQPLECKSKEGKPFPRVPVQLMGHDSKYSPANLNALNIHLVSFNTYIYVYIYHL